MSSRSPVYFAAIALQAMLALVLCLPDVQARETPSSYGEPATVDNPLLRVPMMKKPPTIDGVMEQGEWEDASALSGFWYDYGNADFRFLAPLQTQLQVYVAYDKDNLYYCIDSPIYPENSWLKARGRFPDVLHHPLYGILQDDHLELELRPWQDVTTGFQRGLLRWDINPINAVADWTWAQTSGPNMRWKSNATVRSQANGKRWVVEIAMPFSEFRTVGYEGNDKDGKPLITLPPPDGTVYRAWFVRGIGGNGNYFNAYDAHVWNTTKTQLVFDSQAPSFQINELGPIMEDVIDVKLTVKNHNTRSETVQLGFFVESAEGPIYSSFDSPELQDGLLELRPGEVRQINLKKPFPGISTDGNVLWFDVRSAGKPGKILYRCRLTRFHSMDGGETSDSHTVVDPATGVKSRVATILTFRKRRLDVIETLRPPKKDFEFLVNYSNYDKRLSGFVDRGIQGASDEAQTAVEAKLLIMKANEDEDLVKEVKAEFHGAFSNFLVDLPELVNGESYKVSLLLFDANKRIVGERNMPPFTHTESPWMHNTVGLDDVVWEPFTDMVVTPTGFETLKHSFTLTPSGLPATLVIKATETDLPLEMRVGPAGEKPATTPTEAQLIALGRGNQLRAPMRLEAVIDGKRAPVEVVEPAKLVRQWKSELEYVSKLRAGGVDLTLTIEYDCDGSMHASMVYSAATPTKIDGLEMVMDVAGVVDLAYSETGHGAMTGADAWDCTLKAGEGVVWDSTGSDIELVVGHHIPWFFFGSADRAWSWYSDTDRGWMIDKQGSTMQLERNAAGDVTWRTKYINHPVEVSGTRTIAFNLLTHPAKPKPTPFRLWDWHYLAGSSWADGYMAEEADLTDKYLIQRWHTAASAPADMPYEQAPTWRNDKGPWHRYGQWRNVGVSAQLDREWEEKGAALFGKHISVGRRVGWWMDEYFPVAFGRSDNLAKGHAYLRDPESMGENELPWQPGFLTTYMRGYYKRLARVSATSNVPQRQHTWSNNASNLTESFIHNSLLVEECGAMHRSYDVDMVTQFPNSLYRAMSKNYTGLVTTLMADTTFITPGDDKRLDRQMLGRALLNDIGVTPNGAHGTIQNKEQAVRLINLLSDFGYFEETGTEKLPYWRNSASVRIGTEPSETSRVYVTAYRRPLAGGGYKAIFVIMNESEAAVELPLTVVDPAAVFGGANTLTGDRALPAADAVPAALADWWKTVRGRDAGLTVLKDLESDALIQKQAGAAGESYGPIAVPYHDYRVLYGEYRP